MTCKRGGGVTPVFVHFARFRDLRGPTALTVALHASAYHNEDRCHAAPFGDAQGMLREAARCNAMLCNGEQRGFSEMVRGIYP
jgi:hypothetical protein